MADEETDVGVDNDCSRIGEPITVNDKTIISATATLRACFGDNAGCDGVGSDQCDIRICVEGSDTDCAQVGNPNNINYESIHEK